MITKIDPDDVRFFSGRSHPALAQKIASYLEVPLIKTTFARFSNDNLFIQLGATVRGRSVYVFQSLIPPVSEHLMELFIMLDIARSAGAREVHAVIPYFSYSRSDKKDAPRISTLRLLKTAITNKIIEKNTKEIDGAEIISLIRKDVARHQDSITQFRNGRREDLATKETAELEILRSYLPKEPSLEEIKETVKAVISEINASGKKDFGKVMKISMEKLKNSCDGKVLSTIVGELLSTS